MKKVAFFLDNEKFSTIDCSDILKGNPGIGGTENMFYLISCLLSMRNNDIDVTFFLTNKQKLPKGLKCEIVGDLSSCIKVMIKQSYDFLIVKHDVKNIYDNSFENLEIDNLRIIIWAHVFMCYWELDYYAKNKNIYKIVNVGREALELYTDHPAFEKSCYIYNCIALPAEPLQLPPFNERKNIVTYIGQLSPFKGFHLLAEAWPYVLQKIPDAELYVIGSGRLYDKNSKLGPFGLAESNYEKKFTRHIIDESGKIIPSVHFMGVMGNNKDIILFNTKVGVPNPSGITETFCISAVEMQVNGAWVTTIKTPGYFDTIKNGALYSKRKHLAGMIIKGLRLKSTDYSNSMNYFKNHFSYEAVSSKWESLINNGIFNDELVPTNLNYRFKWLKIFLRNLKHIFPVLSNLPYLERFLIFIERKFKGHITYLDSNIN